MTTFHNFTLKKKLVELQGCLIFLTYSTYLEHQKLVIFGLPQYPINHKSCRESWNLVLMILGDTFTHDSHFMGKSFSPHPETNSAFCMET